MPYTKERCGQAGDPLSVYPASLSTPPGNSHKSRDHFTRIERTQCGGEIRENVRIPVSEIPVMGWWNFRNWAQEIPLSPEGGLNLGLTQMLQYLQCVRSSSPLTLTASHLEAATHQADARTGGIYAKVGSGEGSFIPYFFPGRCQFAGMLSRIARCYTASAVRHPARESIIRSQ
jgi:hypothetical protein